MKRFFALLLSLATMLSCFCICANASAYDFYCIRINAGNGVIKEKAIIQGDEIYIPATSFENYTRFSFDSLNMLFLINGQQIENAFKSVKILPNQKKALVSAEYVVELTDCFTVDDSLYLPLCQMLPILNADIYEVKNDVIYIANNSLSMAEVLYDFAIEEYWFDFSAEFCDNPFLAELFVLPNYLLDSVTHFRLNRLDILTHSGTFNDYKDIFSAFLADDNLYMQAMAQDPKKIDSTLTFFKKTNETASNIKSAYDWIEAGGTSPISTEEGGLLLASMKEYYNSGELMFDDIKGINDAWTGGKASISNCIDTINYIYTYVTQVDDNRKMLDAVYDTKRPALSMQADRQAAKRVYDLYGERVIQALIAELTEKYATKALTEYITPLAVYQATAKVADTILQEVLPFDYNEIAMLPLYADIANTAMSKYLEYDTQTVQATENKRLSLLLCLMASKKCFSIMEDSGASFGFDTTYYKQQINKLETMIMGLYIAGANTTFDAFENFETLAKANISKIEEGNIEYEAYIDFSGGLPEGSIGDLSDIAFFAKSVNIQSNIGTCVATDGKYMYVADGMIRKYGPNGTIEQTFDVFALTIAYADGKIIFSDGTSIKCMDPDGTNVQTITTANHGTKFCYQNNKIFFLQQIEFGSAFSHLCSIDMNGENFRNYQKLATTFVYADSQTVYFGYKDKLQGIHMYYYRFEDDTILESWQKPGPEASVYDLNFERITADGKNIYFTTCSNNSELGLYRLSMSGSDRKRLEQKGFRQAISCGNRIYLTTGVYTDSLISYYDLTTKKLSKIYSIVYSDGIVVDVLGDYVFVSVNDMESSIRIQRVDELEPTINGKPQE